MEELEALQNEFKRLQSQTAAFRLSERSVVEILMQLTHKGKLSVLHTMNGKELVTPEKLETEIMDELIAHRGRINLTDLQPLLNIDLSHIEKKVADLVKKDSQYRLIEGEIISNLYLDSVAEEINETIQSKGELHVTDLSRRFGLSSEFLQELIERRLGKQIKARMEGQMLYTDDFIKRQEAQIRGLFSAVTRPTPVATLFSRGNFHEGLFDTILEELISEGRLSGSVMGRRERAQYVPNIYNQARQAWIESFFAQNGFVEYNTLAKAQIENPQKFLQSHYPSGIALDNFFVADRLLIVIDSSVGEAIRGDSWVDVTTLAPTMFSVSDCSALLMACPSLKAATAAGTASNLPKRKEREREREREKEREASGEGKSTSAYTQSAHCNTTILNNIFVVSRGFLERCVRLFEQKIEVDVRENAAAAKAPPPSSGEEDEEVEEPVPTKKGRKGRQQVQEEDDEPPAKGKGRRAAGKGGKKRGGDGGGKTRGGGARGEQAGNAEDEGADQEKLVSWLREGFGEECPEELLEAVAEHLRSIASDIRQAVSKSIFKDAITNQRKQHEQFLNEFDARYADILLFHHGAQAFATETGEDDEGLLEKHLLRTLCTDVVNSLIQNQALHHFVECEAIRSPSDRAQIISQLPPKVAKPLDRQVKALSAKSSVEQFLEELDASASVFQLQLKKLDKKRERQLIFSHRQAMLEQLQQQTDPVRVLHLVLLLLYLKNFSAPIHCPGRAAGLLIRVLSTKIPPEAAQQLQEFHRLVVERIQHSGLTESSESTSSEQEPSLTESTSGSTEATEDAEVLEKVSALKQLVQDKKKATD